MKKLMIMVAMMVMAMASLPTMAREAEQPTMVETEEETTVNKFREIVEDIETCYIEEEEGVIAFSKEKNLIKEYFFMSVDFDESGNEDGYSHMDVTVSDGSVKVNATGTSKTVKMVYTYEQYIDEFM